ncbi:hypothetical protein Rhal01_03774 [Rubritalea halochordaticola]|uniref:Uncharacterized protein n=1 Tax=Rubritalea halochordaticola TaxID=714537 RepID=A0ABP9V4T4_9BACT
MMTKINKRDISAGPRIAEHSFHIELLASAVRKLA